MSDSVACQPVSNDSSVDTIVVTAPARLHFGLLELCQDALHQFGGIGMMIDQPSTELRFRMLAPTAAPCHVANQRTTSLDVATRIEKVMASTGSCLKLDTTRLQVSVERLSAQHAGLGSGTQLAAAVATGVASSTRLLMASCDATTSDDPLGRSDAISAREVWERWASIGCGTGTAEEQLTDCAKRGARSHIGLFGFLHGGFVFDSGDMKASWPHAAPSPQRILERTEIPKSWRVILVTPKLVEPVHGQLEVDFIRQCGQRSNGNRSRMLRLIEDAILPNLRTGTLDVAGDAIHEYSVLAGELFRPVQGGVFRDQTTTFVVHKLRDLGLKAVGQSSWGPTVFGIVASQEQADWTAQQWQASADTGGLEVRIAHVNNTGACVRLVRSSASQ